MARAGRSSMHVIWCLKAQEKTKIIGKEEADSGKQEYIPLGMQPIWEKNNLYPMLLVFSVDPNTHISTVTKCHDDLWDLFKQPKLITKDDGTRVRQWNEGAAPEDGAQLKKRAEAAAREGIAAYRDFFTALPKAKQKLLVDCGAHNENKQIADEVDKAIPTFGSPTDKVEWPDGFDGPRLNWNGEMYIFDETTGNYRKYA
jgi:hypothetical protein